MSAYIVSAEQINAITKELCTRKYFSYVYRGKVRKLSTCDFNRVANKLVPENYNSVNDLYVNQLRSKQFGPRLKAERHVYAKPSREYSKLDLYKLTQCLQYNSDTHDKYPHTEAGAMTLALLEALARDVIDKLKEYQDAEWSVD